METLYRCIIYLNGTSGSKIFDWLFTKLFERRKEEYRHIYMDQYNYFVDIFNDNIDETNRRFEALGEPACFGDYVEDVNPNYVAMIRDDMLKYFAPMNAKTKVFNYEIGKYGQIIGRFKRFPEFTVEMVMEEVTN